MFDCYEPFVRIYIKLIFVSQTTTVGSTTTTVYSNSVMQRRSLPTVPAGLKSDLAGAKRDIKSPQVPSFLSSLITAEKSVACSCVLKGHLKDIPTSTIYSRTSTVTSVSTGPATPVTATTTSTASITSTSYISTTVTTVNTITTISSTYGASTTVTSPSGIPSTYTTTSPTVLTILATSTISFTETATSVLPQGTVTQTSTSTTYDVNSVVNGGTKTSTVNGGPTSTITTTLVGTSTRTTSSGTATATVTLSCPSVPVTSPQNMQASVWDPQPATQCGSYPPPSTNPANPAYSFNNGGQTITWTLRPDDHGRRSICANYNPKVCPGQKWTLSFDYICNDNYVQFGVNVASGGASGQSINTGGVSSSDQISDVYQLYQAGYALSCVGKTIGKTYTVMGQTLGVPTTMPSDPNYPYNKIDFGAYASAANAPSGQSTSFTIGNFVFAPA